MLAEELTRIRRPDDRERYAASQRQAKIDPNPHQIDAVIFALRRIREGGCILADEVGLGKTIEAGLVIAQSRAEGARRVLLIVPKSLIGQWQDELLKLFGIYAREQKADFFAPGVYLVGREFAGSEDGAEALGAAPPFDLVVIDEAHEIFAGLHKRYGPDGIYGETADQALMAHRVRGFLRTAPVLLLTATPMQNSLVELWGLVQYVEPTGTLLGRHRDVPPRLLPDRRPHPRPRSGARAAAAPRHGPAAHAPPSGAGVSRPSIHAAALPPLRIQDERRRAVAL